MEQSCFFKCDISNKPLVTCGTARIVKIIDASKQYSDNLHVELQERLDADPNLKIQSHKTCVSSYTSLSHIRTYLKKHGQNIEQSSEQPPTKRSKRSELPAFDFRENCLFCGEVCIMDPDPRHPDRWRKAKLCMTANRGDIRKTFKQAILDICSKRKDDWAQRVEIRLQGAISDLHAADGRYHEDCKSKFMTPRAVKAAARNVSSDKEQLHYDKAFEAVLNIMKSDMSRIWNSAEIHKQYLENDGDKLTRNALVQKISDHFGNDLLILSATGLANLLLFRSTAHNVLKIEEDDNDNDHLLGTIAKQIVKETKNMPKSDNEYSTRLDKDNVLEYISPTLLSLLSKLTEKLNSTLPASLIGNIITSLIKSQPTTLQIALGLMLRGKTLIEQFYKFGITCSYDEVLRFKESAAAASAKSSNMSALSDAKDGLVQAVADNFDANISSQNGLRSTHALALLLTQNQTKSDESYQDKETIRRLKKTELKNELTSDIPVQFYKGPKRPNMPELEAKRTVLPLKVLAQQNIVLRRAKEADFCFLKNVVADNTTPEYGGFNTKMSRNQGQSLKPGTKAVYTPLIDMVPSDPDTMMTAMVEAQRLTKLTGQSYTIFTNDQQLYKVAVNVMWVYPNLFSEFIPRLGGMHMLMSFIGSVGFLMANSGLEEVMKAAFGGVPRMLTGKNFPQNTRALRMVAEEVLRGVLTSIDLDNTEDLMSHLEDKASNSRTAKLWVDNLIKPVFIMMLFVRAEREADWTLHLWAVREMLPYFFAAGHMNYARYGLYYLRSMERLPEKVLERFLKGEHVMRHKAGIWNGMWSDMFIETTFMRYGHSPGGLIGITLSPSTVKRWALSLHICNRLTNDVVQMTEASQSSNTLSHKEEMPAHIKSDFNDRNNIRKKLETCIDPLNPEIEPEQIVNIVSGRISPQSVNVDISVEIGRQQMIQYEASWPEGFNDTLSKKVTTMSVSKKQVTIGSSGTFDTELIYSRVMGLLHTREIDLANVFQYELAPVPTSMFNENGDMRISGAKSTLKVKLQVEQSVRTLLPAQTIIMDGCAILWVLHWPTSGTVEDYVNCFVDYVLKKLCDSDIYVVFDRYYDYSMKSSTRNSRAGKQASRKHRLNLNTPLPPQQVVLTVTDNKKQLIDIICQQMLDKGQTCQASQHHKLIVTGKNPNPQEVYKGKLTERQDLRTTHEEADVIIPQQVIAASKSGSTSIKVVSDDTDVFILLLHYYHSCQLKCQLLMEGTSTKRCVIDIKATVQKHAKIVPQLLAAHALTGCDTVAYMWGIGKVTVLKVLLAGYTLDNLGLPEATIGDVIAEATKFVAACYGSKSGEDMSKVRYEIWLSKTSKKKITKTPKLQSLPPTSEAFGENVKRAHLQVCTWKSAGEADPPDLNSNDHGWFKDDMVKSLSPTLLPPNVAPAPAAILQMICCGCSTEHPCSTARCGCVTAQLACTVFCGCHVQNVYEKCNNPWSKHVASDTENANIDKEVDDENEIPEQ